MPDQGRARDSLREAPAPIEPSSPLSDLRPGAILLGFVVDNVASLVSSMLIWLVLLARVASGTPDELTDEAFDAVARSPELLVATLLAGVLCTVLGGYVAARRAAVLHVRHGAFVGIADIVLGLTLLVLLPADPSDPPAWYDLVAFLLVVPAGMAGGFLAARGERAAPRRRGALSPGPPPWSP